MDISGTDLYNKIREIMPEMASRITPEMLNKACDDPSVQPFLEWFRSSVGCDNVLYPDEVRLAEQMKKQSEWLEDDDELDAALLEATKGCPELMKLVTVDSTDAARLSDRAEAEKDDYKEDMDYRQTLEDSLKNLKELGMKLDDDIETEESQLEKDHIRVNKMYMDCMRVLEEFDMSHRQFFTDIECLVRVYAEAVEKKGTPVVWTQVPLELFIKQLEIHNDYLGAYVKRHFSGQVDRVNDSDHENLIDDGKERFRDEKVCELLKSQTDIITSKTDEISLRINESACSAMAAQAVDIYNSGASRTPQTEMQLQAEIAALTSKRDILEENIALLRDTQLQEIVRLYATLEITKINVRNGHAGSARRKRRLEKLEHLRTLAGEKGHGYSDLVCMLMQLQLKRLKEIVEFVANGRHYLATEYSRSSVRSDIMQQQQSKFNDIMKAAPAEQNVFNKILTSLLPDTENRTNNRENLEIKECDKLVEDNEKLKKDLLGVHLDKKIDNLQPLQDKVMSMYNSEVREGPTNSLKSTPYKLITRLEESTKGVREMQDSVNQIRAKIKDMKRKTANSSVERDTTILWQRFLGNPAELQKKYDDAKKEIEGAHFVDKLDL